MEQPQGHLREKARPPYPRTASRSSNGTTHSRLMSQSANSSTSQISASPRPHTVHPSHRYHHQTCAKPPPSPRSTSSRPVPQLSREGSIESARATSRTPVSSFLQEKLQKERQAEGHRMSASKTSIDMSSPVDFGTATQRSPTKYGSHDGIRPQSRGSVDSSTRKGLCLKEMEQVVSGLHKLNFDLKLELYHRRERQTVLEDRLESLESEKTQVEDINDKLMEELEKRDKAVEEAVAMIVVLEAKMDILAQERDMVRQVESEGFPRPSTYDQELGGPSPRSKTLDLTKLDADANVLNRMPSFLSERTEHTANLRNVYLGVRGSVLSLPRVAEGSSDMDNGHVDRLGRLASPSLSVLSESSFVSVYGRKSDDKDAPSNLDEPMSLDGVPGKTGMVDRRMPSESSIEGSSGTPTSSSFSRGNGSAQFQPIASIVGGSPLQQIEKWDSHYSSRKLTPQPSLRSGKVRVASDSSEITNSPGHQGNRDQKRAGLRKVMTDAPGGVSLSDQRMPPTPDTVTSSVLRRFKHSDDTLSRRQDGLSHRSQGSLSSLGPSIEQVAEHGVGVSLESKLAPITRNNIRNVDNNYHKASQIQRPRSADETTVSHRNERRWSIDSGGSNDSFESSLDIWLRAGGSKQKKGGRASPDLFGFPTSASRGGWATDAMFGPNTVYTGGASIAPDPGPNSDQMHDLFSAQEAWFGGADPPPPPNRRSSLNAQTALTPPKEVAPKPVKDQKSPRKPRHYRRNSDDVQIRSGMKTPMPGQLTQPSPQHPADGDQRRNHYPPISGSAGPRNGLVRLWRRSIGGGSSNTIPVINPTPEVAHPIASEPAVVEAPKNLLIQTTGMPSWVNRSSAAEDDRTGCTPPPIMLKSRHGRGHSMSDVEPYGPLDLMIDSTLPTTPMTAMAPGAYPEHFHMEGSPAAGSATGTRRKWLPSFGRGSNLKG